MASTQDLRKALTIDHFNVDPSELNSEKEYDFWIKKLTLYLARLKADDGQKLEILINKISADTYGYKENAANYADAVKRLDKIFKKKPNVLYARYKLHTIDRNPG